MSYYTEDLKLIRGHMADRTQEASASHRTRSSTVSSTLSFASNVSSTPSQLGFSSGTSSMGASPPTSFGSSAAVGQWKRPSSSGRQRTLSGASTSLLQLQVVEQDEEGSSTSPQALQPSPAGDTNTLMAATSTGYFERAPVSSTSRVASPLASTPGSLNASATDLAQTPPIASKSRSKLSLLKPSLLRKRSQISASTSREALSASSSHLSLPLAHPGPAAIAHTLPAANPHQLGRPRASTVSGSTSMPAPASVAEPVKRPKLLSKWRRRPSFARLTGQNPSEHEVNVAQVDPPARFPSRQPLPRFDSSPTLSFGTMPGGLKRASSPALWNDITPEDQFDARLPRELRLRIFQTLVDLVDAIDAGPESLPSKGKRELLRVSSVSKTWHSLAFDGLFWNRLDAQSWGVAPDPRMLVTVANHAGSFVRHLQLSGCRFLQDETLAKLTTGLCGRWNVTMLTTLGLDGCLHITTFTLNKLLQHSPTLRNVNLACLDAVRPSTLLALFKASLQLTSLNVSFCRNLPGSALVRPSYKHVAHTLRRLGAASLSELDDQCLPEIPGAYPQLRQLDLRFNPGISDKGIKALSASIKKSQSKVLGDVRHLALSGCNLTDEAFAALADCFPKLEVLEAAGIGSVLGDEGIDAFLATTPLIRKLDLEGADSLTDRVLRRLAPPPGRHRTSASNLEHLILNRCSNLTDEGILRVVRQCPALRVLEADNTKIQEGTIKTFIKLAKERKTKDAEIVAVDCRSFSRNAIPALMHNIRPRRAIDDHRYRNLNYVLKSRM